MIQARVRLIGIVIAVVVDTGPRLETELPGDIAAAQRPDLDAGIVPREVDAFGLPLGGGADQARDAAFVAGRDLGMA
jgi:hypothetical protein